MACLRNRKESIMAGMYRLWGTRQEMRCLGGQITMDHMPHTKDLELDLKA